MATTTAEPSLRQRLLQASGRIRRVKRLDRLATVVIVLGGVLVIVAVSFIFVFILGEALPLFRPAAGEHRGSIELAAVPDAGEAKPLLIGIDEYQLYLYEVLADGRVVFFRTSDGSLAREFPLPDLQGARITAASRSILGDYLVLGTADGRLALRQVWFRPVYQQQTLVDLDLEVRERGVFQADAVGRPLRAVDYEETDGRKTVVGVVGDDEIVLLRSGYDDEVRAETLRTRGGERITHVRIGRGDTLVASTEAGRIHHWDLVSEPPLLNEVADVAAVPITALSYTLGNVSLIVGDARGGLSAWFRVRVEDEDADLSFVKAHTYPGQDTPIRAIGPSSRDKSFVTAGEDGTLVLRHLTSGRSLISFPGEGVALEQVLITPKLDGIVAKRADGRLARYDVASPHPEVSWQALFRKVWYEGYAEPEYVWQSTGGTDDFEPKFSLVPLIFGTIKGTVYALLFAIPLATMGALYTSQFMHPTIKAKVKPTVEIMAALPSVVVGFIAGLWLASRVEREIVPVLLMLALLPAFGTAGILLWGRLPRAFASRLRPGMEVALILPLLLAGAWVALRIGPGAEAVLFGGDFRAWLNQALDLVYDQRNSLVVGLAMGFAVIPIIFTISEDSFSSVPSHLSAASLALGASRWQTALRVVLPTASPGVFSAVMIGFGRAVGETMIVLMATGNTPVLDWSIFNGMRTLSANIAVEIPEAPHGGTLYRVLFLAGLVLFLMTFVVNTIAEIVRQRLRERYRAL